MSTDSGTFEDIYFSARDGLKLHARCYPAKSESPGRSLLCLAGLTRNGRDFHDLAVALSSNPSAARTVYALDYRGRGLSESDADWKNYTIQTEMLDAIDFMTFAELHDAAIIGTSRGGLITMLMAAAQPTSIAAVILNDIGPVIEHEGLARITSYVGRMPLPISWADATKMVRDLNRRQFPEISDEQWEDVARQWYNERNGRPIPGYDRKLGNALSILDGPIPALWPQFEALKRVPTLVIRGENSDLLTAATVDEMRRRHPDLATLTVPGQGHAPFLKDSATIEAIRHFLAAADVGRAAARMAMVQ